MKQYAIISEDKDFLYKILLSPEIISYKMNFEKCIFVRSECDNAFLLAERLGVGECRCLILEVCGSMQGMLPHSTWNFLKGK